MGSFFVIHPDMPIWLIWAISLGVVLLLLELLLIIRRDRKAHGIRPGDVLKVLDHGGTQWRFRLVERVDTGLGSIWFVGEAWPYDFPGGLGFTYRLPPWKGAGLGRRLALWALRRFQR